MEERNGEILEYWKNAVVEIVKTVEVVQIVGRPKQEVRREKGISDLRQSRRYVL